MGRKKIYVTNEQRRENDRQKSARYYERHKTEIKNKRMLRYWENKT